MIGSLALAAALALGAEAAERPNILLIVGDDWGWTDFGFMGHPEVKTPHLDKLAGESAVFPNGSTPTSLCRASLATILTGQYAHQHRICCNDPPEGLDRSAMLPFLRESPALPRLLGAAGYRSFQTGKFWEGHYANAGFNEGMTTKGRHGEEGLVIGRKTMQPIYDFIAKGKDRPFFIWYAPMMPHLPHDPPDRLLAKYSAPGRDPRLAKYWAMCERTDETIGELLGHLDREGLAERTIVLFVVDNGWVQALGPAKPADHLTTRSKNSPYDGGVRTPLIVKWPGKTKPGSYPDLVSTVDIVPTLLSAAGAPIPESLPGLPLWDAAEGKGPLKRDTLFGEIYLHTATRLDDPRANLTHRWARSGDWKLILPVEAGGKPELFNLKDDPREEHNLAAESPGRVEELTAKLDAFLAAP